MLESVNAADSCIRSDLHQPWKQYYSVKTCTLKNIQRIYSDCHETELKFMVDVNYLWSNIK